MLSKKSLFQNLFNRFHLPSWILVVLLASFILRIPSFFEPFSYGDEMIYLTMGEGVRRNLTLYKDLHDNKPPLLYFTAAIAGNVFWFKVILAAWSMITVVVFWRLTQKLFPQSHGKPKIATIFFALLTTLPLFEGQIANAENFLILPTILGFLLAISIKDNLKNIFLIGVVFSIATLFKVPAVFDMLALLAFWFITTKREKGWLKRFFVKSSVLVTGFIAPISLTFIWYFAKGALNEYLVAAFAQNVGYLSSWRPQDAAKPFIVRNFPLIVRGLIVLGGSGALFFFRKKLSASFVMATVWALFALFAATLSERPYPHYLLQVVPSIAILFAIFSDARLKEQVYALIPILLFTFVPVYFKYYEYSSISYYKRFLDFVSGTITKDEYFRRFDGNIKRNYEIATFIKSSTTANEKIFVWGDSPPIYAMSRRLPPLKYVAEYHINDFSSQEETIGALEKNKPSFIVVLPGAPAFPKLTEFLTKNYLEVQTIDKAKIWRIMKPEIKEALERLQ